MSVAPFRRRHQHYVEPRIMDDLCAPTLWGDGVQDDTAALQWRVDHGAPFTPPSVRVDTSEAAAQAIQPAAPTIREAIFALIAQSPDGLTAGELEARTAYSGSTIRPRLRELEGSAPWAKGQLPARIVKTSAQRLGMRVYRTLA